MVRLFSIRKSSLFSREDGGIAVEFALLTPLLVASFLAMGLMGMKTYKLLNIEQVVQAGLEAAVKDPGMIEVADRMRAAAEAKGYSVWTGSPPIPLGHLFITVVRNCSCPETLGIAQSACNVPCSGGRPMVVRYSLVASLVRTQFETSLMNMLFWIGPYLPTLDVTAKKEALIR